MATMSGVCLSKVTSSFPRYQLSKVYKDIQCAFKSESGDVSTLPTVPDTIAFSCLQVSLSLIMEDAESSVVLMKSLRKPIDNSK